MYRLSYAAKQASHALHVTGAKLTQVGLHLCGAGCKYMLMRGRLMGKVSQGTRSIYLLLHSARVQHLCQRFGHTI